MNVKNKEKMVISCKWGEFTGSRAVSAVIVKMEAA